MPSATAGPTSPARCSNTGTRRPPTAVSRSSRATFEGAWPYLQLIAAANRIDDPLDPRVVDAYWVGNGLLDKVGAASRSRDTSRTGSAAVSAVAGGTSSTRSQQAPFRTIRSTSSRSTRGSVSCGPGSSTSRCASSTSAGRRRRRYWRSKETGPRCSHPFSPGAGASFELGPMGRAARCAGARTGWPSRGRPKPGDWVSLHWDFVCERMTSIRARRLLRTHRRRRSMRSIAGRGRPTRGCGVGRALTWSQTLRKSRDVGRRGVGRPCDEPRLDPDDAWNPLNGFREQLREEV